MDKRIPKGKNSISRLVSSPRWNLICKFFGGVIDYFGWRIVHPNVLVHFHKIQDSSLLLEMLTSSWEVLLNWSYSWLEYIAKFQSLFLIQPVSCYVVYVFLFRFNFRIRVELQRIQNSPPDTCYKNNRKKKGRRAEM